MKPLVSQPARPGEVENPLRSQTAWSAGRRAVQLSFLLAVLIMVVSTVRIGAQVIRYQDLQMDYDEATHATRGYENLYFYPRQLLRETSGCVPLILTLVGIILWIKRREFLQTLLPYAA